jgi:hypothetical protein
MEMAVNMNGKSKKKLSYAQYVVRSQSLTEYTVTACFKWRPVCLIIALRVVLSRIQSRDL